MRWGVIPILVERLNELDQMFDFTSNIAKKQGFAKDNDTVVLVAGVPIGQTGSTNLLRVITIGGDDDR